jgi:hypothetical protein
MDNKYKNGKIYTIRYRNDDTLIYVGSTVVPLCKRFSKHKTDSKNPKNENIPLYQKFKETDINDWYIELYEDCPCERKEQLNKREGQVIRELGTLNKQIPGRTIQEWREDNKEKLKEYNKEYHKEYGSEHILCDCGCSVIRGKIERHKRSSKHERIMKELDKKEILGEQI